MDISNQQRCYHGTGKSSYSKKGDNYFKILRYDISTEFNKKKQGKTYKLPGSLGYGIYTFTTEEMAKLIAGKFYSDPMVLDIGLNPIEDSILDLNDMDTQENFHEFRLESYKSAEKHFENFNAANDKQHVFDGIVIELYIKKLQKNNPGLIVSAVRLKTYTPLDKEKKNSYSYIPNGTELCLRDDRAIKEVIEGG